MGAHALRNARRARSEAWGWVRVTLFVFLPVAALSAAYVHRLTLIGLISMYGALSVGRVIVQSAMATAVRRRRPRLRTTPMISIVVTVFNPTSLDNFDRALRSLAEQEWPEFEVIVVDDGSDDPDQHRRVCEAYGFRYVYQENAGKRDALYRAFSLLSPRSKYVLTADDDTVWHPMAAASMIAELQQQRVGATTGHVATLNEDDNWLTKITAIRYWIAFEVERAAQGFFGVVTCVSGPLGGYRRDLLDLIKDDFVDQRFLGRRCTFGDDRHLTNLILRLGYRVTYSRAVAWTESPAEFGKYRRQQTRWGKSSWRELAWTFSALGRHPIYLAFDWALTLLLPFLLVAALAWYAVGAVVEGPEKLLAFVAMIVGMALVRAVPASMATRDPRFLWMLPAFSVFHLLVLLPLKFVSLVTVADGRWGTRKAAEALPEPPAVWDGEAPTEILPKVPA